jgi:hypothetical protein
MPFTKGAWVLYTGVVTDETVVIDEVLDADFYGVRFLDMTEVFTVHESDLRAG